VTYALVSHGTPGTNLAPAFGQPTTAGNLLLCFVTTDSSSATNPFTITGTGWTQAAVTGGSFNWGALFYRANCGASESAPTLGDGGAGAHWSGLAEFSGGATSSPLDKTGTAAGATATASGADSAAGDLVAGLGFWDGATNAPNLGMTMTGSQNTALTVTTLSNTGGAPPLFYIFGWAVNSASLGATANSVTVTADQFENSPGTIITSFLAAATPPAPGTAKAAGGEPATPWFVSAGIC